MDTEGEGRIRALVTFAGNPVLSTPNGARLDRALACGRAHPALPAGPRKPPSPSNYPVQMSPHPVERLGHRPGVA